MKITTLNAHASSPCFLLDVRRTKLLLDCSLHLPYCMNFVPAHLDVQQQQGTMQDYTSDFADGELKCAPLQKSVLIKSALEFGVPAIESFVNMCDIDAILISNHNCMLALPFFTENTGFRGQIFCTEPTLQFGRLSMEELLDYQERSTTRQESARKWKQIAKSLPHPLCDAKNPYTWRTLYSRADMESCISRVTLVGYNERKDIFGLLQVSPVSSGYRLGSSNWIISWGQNRIAYVSGSSTLTTHPRPMDQSALRGVDCLVLASLTQTPLDNPNPMIEEFCRAVIDTIKTGGNVLVPCSPSGINYDLFECLGGQMEVSGLMNTPLFFVSPVSESSLAYSNIMAEWLSDGKQNRVYVPEEPFVHGQLIKAGRLKTFSAIHEEDFSNEYRQPCVMFCGHPSLRMGDSLRFIELWAHNTNNTIIFTEPGFNYLSALSPFQPLQMRTVYCPIDTNLNFSQAKKLIAELKPKCIAVPESYTKPPPEALDRTDLTIEVEGIERYVLGEGQTVSVALGCNHEAIKLDPRLAGSIVPKETNKPGLALATVTGNLVVSNNNYELLDLSSSPHVRAGQKRRRGQHDVNPAKTFVPVEKKGALTHLFGRIDVEEFLRRLQSDLGVADAQLRLQELQPGKFTLHLEDEMTLIQIDEEQTHIISDEGAVAPSSQENRPRHLLRQRLRDLILDCVTQY